MAKVKTNYEEILEMADQYGVKDNVLFVSAAKRYDGQLKAIAEIQADLDARGLVMETIGSTGQTKVEANPLVAQLPKYNDTANKTLGVMLDIITKLGRQAPAGDKLGEFLSE